MPSWHREGNQIVNQFGQVVVPHGLNAGGTDSDCVTQNTIGLAPPSLAVAKAYASWGINVVRVTLNEDCWLGINGVAANVSGANYQDFIKTWVANLNEAGIVAELDLHEAAPAGFVPAEPTQWPMADEDHAPTFWTQVARTFRNSPGVLFDLYNEPFIGQSAGSAGIAPILPATGPIDTSHLVFKNTLADWQCWISGCQTQFVPNESTCGNDCGEVQYQTAGIQQLIDDVRGTGARQLIVVGGLNFAGDPCAFDEAAPGNTPAHCAALEYLFDRTLNPAYNSRADANLMVDYHSYNFDECITAACWNSDVLPLTEGYQGVKGVPVIVDEFGENDCTTTFDDALMNWADGHAIGWLAWSRPDNPPATVTSCKSAQFGGVGSIEWQLGNNTTGAAWPVSPSSPDLKLHIQALAHLVPPNATSVFVFTVPSGTTYGASTTAPPAAAGSTVTYNATVYGKSAPPSGTVTFKTGTTILCATNDITAVDPLAATGSCTSSAAPPGTDGIVATYVPTPGTGSQRSRGTGSLVVTPAT